MAGDDTTDNQGSDHLLQDILPLWAKLILLVLFIVLLVPVGIVVTLLGPKANDVLVDNSPSIDPSEFFNGKDPLVVSSHDVAFGGLRHRLWIALTLQNRLAQQTSLVKEDTQFTIKIYDQNNVTWTDTTISRTLSCPQKSVAPDEPGCEPILLAHFPVVSSASPTPFTAEIRALNLGPISDSGLLENFTSIEWEYSSDIHTIFHIIVHYAFFVVTLALLVGFMAAHIIHLWKNRASAPELKLFNFEPIWIIGLLLLLLFYNNPIYVATYVAGTKSFIFEILNSVFALAFGHFFMLFVLCMLHASLHNPTNYSLKSKEFWIAELVFSAPKILLVGASFLFRLGFLLYFRFSQLQDPTFVGFGHIVLHFLRLLGDISFLVILSAGFYWTMRSFVNAPKLLKDDAPQGFRATRFFLFPKFTFVLILAIFVDFIVLVIVDSPFIRSFGPELFHVINLDMSITGFTYVALNLWVLFITLLHLPATVFGSYVARFLLAINDKDPLRNVPFIRGLIVTTQISPYSDETPFFSASHPPKKNDTFGTSTENLAASRDQPVFSPHSSSPDGYKIHYDDEEEDPGRTQATAIVQSEEEPSQVEYNYGGNSATYGANTVTTSSAFQSDATSSNWPSFEPGTVDRNEYSSF